MKQFNTTHPSDTKWVKYSFIEIKKSLNVCDLLGLTKLPLTLESQTSESISNVINTSNQNIKYLKKHKSMEDFQFQSRQSFRGET
jgi:hypothetical protein